MSTESMDRRVRKTRRQLRECLISLLKEKKVQDITVRELTDMADLNRGTFYLHYKDVFDLLEKTETELQDEFNQLVLKHDAVDLKQRPAVIFNEIYTLVYENDWMEVFRSGNAAAFDAFFSFIVSGCVGIVQYWLQTGLKETPMQMARLTEQIITQGIGVLEIDPYA